ncbi:putative type II secretion system protein [Campylobacter ureolyticus RIGS 9880]|nr:prepilin-type N-terminal cleavage/methylation domain-containing protein [Campylobacter ureolyticus]AKT91043.1 putative type II secretion system protein [Campylobacter ureolyticus RIGS 9880]MCZ6172396.1 prepilin-type N-terminal cleavage/methylation domain-containing protein [Campylobacter ureolyticus]MDK8323072.1 prepilin-type N-terminal cleavage/methylation domain-containing protein [Campylobacter ureolyticus]
MKKAFTLIELIMVIVILAILSLIGTDIYVNVYKNYLSSKLVDETENKTQLALDQIAARLSDRVKQATIGKRSDTNDTALVYSNTLSQNHDILEWIGQSTQSRNLAAPNIDRSIGWTGFLDLGEYQDGKGILIGGNLPNTISIIDAISTGKSRNLAMIFQGLSSGVDANGYGFRGDNLDKVMIFDIPAGGSVAANVRYSGAQISDSYQIAHSAYAIVPVKDTTVIPNKTDLYLYYDYRPWMRQSYTDGRRSLLVENVTLFRFRGFSASGVDLKLCVDAKAEDSGVTDNRFVVCKSKVVF